MLRNRTSTAWLLLWGGLLFLSFRPWPPLELALDVALAPLCVAAELGSPLSWLRTRTVAAAEGRLASAAEAEAAEGAAALAALAARALPADPALRGARRFVHGEVTDRPSLDQCWVAVRDAAGIVRGSHVVAGDAYVGRVLEVVPGAEGAQATVRIELVTASTFRVGAEVRGEEPIYLTVGGIEARGQPRGRPRSVRLAVHQPSATTLASGLARVHELFPEEGSASDLAEGYVLGEVCKKGERGPWWIEPELDFLDGLFQVAIVTRADPHLSEVAPFAPALADRGWVATRALTNGDPSPWRSTLKIPLGRGHGVRAGAAVTGVGARLLGRVLRAGLSTSDVALLSDVGCTFPAVARVEGEPEPRILGRLTTLGRGPDGALRLRWFVRSAPRDVDTAPRDADTAPRDGDHAVSAERALSARLFTGSGDPGLPGGLFLGEALLPSTARVGEEREILLHPQVDALDVRRLFVRRHGAPLLEGRP